MPLPRPLVGRPNGGNPRLFNRLAGRTAAIVHDTPGVTRDRQAVEAVYDGLSLRLIDTAGFVEAAPRGGRKPHPQANPTRRPRAQGPPFLLCAPRGGPPPR